MSKNEIKGRIVKTDFERGILENTTSDNQNKVIDPVTFSKLEA